MNNTSNNRFLTGWAQAVMLLTNLVFLVLDTTSIKQDADIIRIVVLDLEGKELYNQFVRPMRHLEANTLYTGITQEQIEQAQLLGEQWKALQDVLAGKYVLSYGLDFVQARLHDSAHAYYLPAIFLVGDCLHETAAQYSHRTSIKLTAALLYVGYPQFNMTSATGRARAQILLLKAIADGQPKRLASSAFTPVTVYDDDDDHPF